MKILRIGAAVGLVVMWMIVGGEALGQSTCRALRYKFAGKAALQKAKCYLKASKKGIDVDPACIALADDVMFKKLAKVDLKGDCPSGDPAGISGAVNSFVDGLRLAVGEPTAPACGNDSHELGEACDGRDDANCPGLCLPDCTCAETPGSCGNNTQEVGEACDGTDDASCPGNCLANCTCDGPQACSNFPDAACLSCLAACVSCPIFVTGCCSCAECTAEETSCTVEMLTGDVSAVECFDAGGDPDQCLCSLGTSTQIELCGCSCG